MRRLPVLSLLCAAALGAAVLARAETPALGRALAAGVLPGQYPGLWTLAGLGVLAALALCTWRLRRRVRLAAATAAEQGRELARSEAEMRALFSGLPDLVLQMRGDGTILRLINTRFRLRSPRPGHLAGRSVADIFSAEGSCRLLAAAAEALREDRPGAASLELRQDGERLWLAATVSPLGPDAVLLVCRDESELIRSERKYRDLVEQASCLILRLDAEGNLVFLNDYAERFFGHPAGGLLGRPALGSIVPDDPERARHFRRMLAEIATHPGAYQQEERQNLTRDGRLVWVSWNCRPVFVDGRPAGVLCVGTDMTERRAARDKLLRRERHFGALIANSSDLTTVVDARGRVTFEAPAVRHRLGFAPDQQEGRPLVDMIHPEDRPAFTQAMAALAQSPEATLPLEFRREKSDGSWLWLEAVASNLLDDEAVAGIVLNAHDVSRRRAMEEELRRHVFLDPLTGLPNRALFLDRLGQALARARRSGEGRLAVLYLDLDRFKLVNESLGHAAGDLLLAECASRISDCLRGSDTVARFGSDEFVLLLEELEDDAEALSVIRRIQARLAEPVPAAAAGVEMVASASIGIAYGPGEADDPDRLVRDAHTAMHWAKSTERSGYKVFRPVMRQRAMELFTLEADLRRALEEDRLVLHYQPIVEMRTGRVAGVEALARWPHPGRGDIPPTEFIPLAEETGLIHRLGSWVVERACREMAEVHPGITNGSSFWVGVNLSGKQFRPESLARVVRESLARTGVSPRCLRLELTESVLLDNPAEAAAILDEMRGLGVTLAIDDFGTGYSSLSYLHRFPFDVLKIDRAFVAVLDQPGSRHETILRSIVSLAAGLDMTVVAEGIETEAQLARLLELGCVYGQGFLFARPMAAAELARHLASPPAGGIPPSRPSLHPSAA